MRVALIVASMACLNLSGGEAGSREHRRVPKRNALRLEVVADRESYKPGERVSIVARLRNIGAAPLTILRFIPDGGLHPDSWLSLQFDGQPLLYNGGPLRQLNVHYRVTEDRFVTLQPGDSFPVRAVSFAECWGLGGKDPSLQESYRTSTTAPLKPGKYAVKATYEFRFETTWLQDVKPDGRPGIFRYGWSFEGRSGELLGEAWQGHLEAETEFEVLP